MQDSSGHDRSHDQAAPDATVRRRPGWTKRVPNALTVLRLAMAAGFVGLLSGATPAEPARLVTAAGLFVVAAMTDALDGILARRWDAVSRFGRIADPLADKVLVLGAFVVLAGPGLSETSGVAPWMAVVLLTRELLVTSIRGVYEGLGVDFSASITGKIKMIAQSIAAPGILLAIVLENPGVARALAWLTVVVTAASLGPYVRRAVSAERSIGTKA